METDSEVLHKNLQCQSDWRIKPKVKDIKVWLGKFAEVELNCVDRKANQFAELLLSSSEDDKRKKIIYLNILKMYMDIK